MQFHKPPDRAQAPAYSMTDEEVLERLGESIRRHRLQTMPHMTHELLSEHAGVSRSSVQKIENGKSVTLPVLVRVLRSLNLLDELIHLVPEPEPDLYADHLIPKKERKRARGPQS